MTDALSNPVSRGAIFGSLFNLGSDFARNKLGIDTPKDTKGSSVTAGQTQAKEQLEQKTDNQTKYVTWAIGGVLVLVVLWMISRR